MGNKTDVEARVRALVDDPDRLRLSVVVTTFNEEANIGDCLESLLWADEIMVVDSFSEDRTVEIIERFPVVLHQREYFGSAAQKNWSLDRVQHEWVLIVDADERVPPELAHEILTLLAAGPPAVGYYIRRVNVFVDKVIRHSGWSTDKVVRFFDRSHGRYPNRRVHADLDIAPPTPVLRTALLHYTFRSFDQYFIKFLKYAEWGAAQWLRDGRPAGLMEIGFRPFWRFFRMYILQLGILDGLHGLVLCGLQSFGVFLKYAKVWEYRLRLARGEDVELPAFDDDIATWRRPGVDAEPPADRQPAPRSGQ